MAAILALIGFTAAAAQIVFLRELLVVSGGNEMALGAALAAWLLWTAAGSALGGRLRLTLPILQAAVAAALPLSLAALRAARAWFHATPGEVLGPGVLLLLGFAVLSVPCLICGAMFPAGVRRAGVPGRVYLLEAAGSALGGVAAGIALPYLGSAGVLCGVAALNLAATGRRVLLPAALALPLAAPWLEGVTRARLWQGMDVIAARDSLYGNLVVTRAADTRTLYQNGLAAFTVPDPAADEESVHLALLQHPAPERVLLAGGGSGACDEVLRHPGVRRLDYVELDPAILQLFPVRGRVHETDARGFLQHTGDRFDVIILDLPDPQTAQINRFYTLEFFREAAVRLRPGGVLALRLTGSENYLGPGPAAVLRCVHKTLRQVFPEVVALPGGTVQFFASQRPLLRDAAALIARLRERGLQTTYVREYYLPFRMSADRMAELERQIRPNAATPVNLDFAPAAYRLATAAWNARFRARRVIPCLLAAAAAVLLGALAVRGVCARVAAMGFTLMGLEILLLLGFQARHGYVYHELALLVAGFMAGIAVGSWWGLRSAAPFRLGTLQLAAAAAPLLLCALLRIAAPVLFPFLAVAGGALGGCQFAAATRRYQGSPGTLYAVDLAGAFAGALLLSAWMIPSFGFFWTAGAIAAVNLAALL